MRQFLFPARLGRMAALASLSFLLLVAYSAGAAPATPRYVQGNYATPQSLLPTVPVTYTAAQTSGNLNVVVVGWNDSTTKVSSVRDSRGNIYRLAAGPTVLSGAVSQAIYYAQNISSAPARTNTVTVAFNAAASYPDIRILEYSGIDPVTPMDAAASATGTGAASSTSVPTKNANDLLVGANTVQTMTAGASSGFTARMITDPDGDIAEDRNVTATGSYTVSTPLAGAGGSVMQVVAFRAANSTASPTPTPTPTPKPTPTPTPKPTPTPTPKPSPTPTPKPSPTPSATPAVSSITLTWNANAPTSNPATNTVGYRVHWGTVSGVYTQVTSVGNITTATISNLTRGLTYYIIVTGYNSAGVDGQASNQVSYKVP